MKQEPTLVSTIALCKEFGFGEEITRETLWNEAYRLGRSRWHWGPSWWVNAIGRINTIKSNMKTIAKRLLPILALAALLCGCGTTPSAYTPADLRSDVAQGTGLALDVYPAARPGVAIARDTICAEVGKTNVAPVAIVADLAQAGITNQTSKIIVNAAIFLYNKAFKLIGGDVPTNHPTAQLYLDAMCQGLNDAVPTTMGSPKALRLDCPHLR